MAGLPYYFFPTDYLYPRATANNVDIASKVDLLSVGPVQALKIDLIDGSLTSVDGVRSSSSSSNFSALVMSESDIQKELRRGTPVVVDPRKSDEADVWCKFRSRGSFIWTSISSYLKEIVTMYE